MGVLFYFKRLCFVICFFISSFIYAQDFDNDGLSDDLENDVYGTDMNNPDSDNDGLTDGMEVFDLFTSPLFADTDGDQVNDGYEYYTSLTDPLMFDSDTDGLSDGEEILTYTTNPLDTDTDNDGISDGPEIYIYGSDPLDTDTDDDGLSDHLEVTIASSPISTDSDNDGLSDNMEYFTYNTSPSDFDTDSDGLEDNQEILVYNTDPNDVDTDNDGLYDGPEVYMYGSNPTDQDTDDDGLMDDFEVSLGSSPIFVDSDGDGLSDYDEYHTYSTSPLTWDSDYDGVGDPLEINVYFSDPNDDDYPDYDQDGYISSAFPTGDDCDDNDWNVFQAPEILSTVPASRCGSGSVDLEATPSSGATINWYEAATGGTSIHTGEAYSPNLSETTTYYAEAVNGGCVSAGRTAVVGTINTPQVDEPLSRNANISYTLPILTNGSYYTQSNGLGLNLLAGTPITNTQTIYVYNNDGTCWNEHSFTVTILTALVSGSCGSTFSHLNQILSVRPVIGALNYRYEISDGESTVYFTKGSASTSFTLQEVGGLSYGKTYSIRVAYTTDGDNWTAYGKACSVTVAPLTRINTWYCNKTINNLGAFLSVATVSGASNYRYKLSDGENTYYYERGSSNTEFRLSWVNGTAMNKTYTIQVQSTINGSNWSPYGASCVINTGSGFQKEGESMILEDLKLTAYPNPNNGEFTISSSHEGTFNIINELGQLIQVIEITKENNYETKIEGLQQGLYFITGTINNEVITKKIIVQ